VLSARRSAWTMSSNMTAEKMKRALFTVSPPPLRT
jgi:hypothetical protein